MEDINHFLEQPEITPISALLKNTVIFRPSYSDDIHWETLLLGPPAGCGRCPRAAPAWLLQKQSPHRPNLSSAHRDHPGTGRWPELRCGTHWLRRCSSRTAECSVKENNPRHQYRLGRTAAEQLCGEGPGCPGG